MQCRLCLRRELHLCPAKTGTPAAPLTLRREDGLLLTAEFDCARCLMLIKSP
jgi:hypothetical protein